MQKGDVVEEFTAIDQSDREVSLSDLIEEGPIVLFFYPKAMTGGCTAESCHFRDLRSEFEEHGARAVGISADSVERQAKFDRVNDLDLLLLSDPDRTVAKLFGVKRPGPLWNKRMTFVIDRDRRVLDVIGSEMNMEIHADRALEALEAVRV